jgi:hypothetical protein
MWHVWGRREVYTGFWWGTSERKKPLGRPKRRWEYNNRLDFKEKGFTTLTGLILLKIQTSGWLF